MHLVLDSLRASDWVGNLYNISVTMVTFVTSVICGIPSQPGYYDVKDAIHKGQRSNSGEHAQSVSFIPQLVNLVIGLNLPIKFQIVYQDIQLVYTLSHKNNSI
jgi:hypothetical protein